VFRAQSSDAAASFLMAVVHHLASHVQLRNDVQSLVGFIVNGFQLKCEPSEALGQGVMHFVGKTPALVENTLKPPALDEDIGGQAGHSKQKKPYDKRDDMASAPPRRSFEQFYIA
jgi:hypothetical protein